MGVRPLMALLRVLLLLPVRLLLRMLLLVLLLSLPRRVKSVEPPKHPNFFVGRGVVLLAVVGLVLFGVVSIVRVLDLDLAEGVLSPTVLKEEEVVVGSLPRDLDLIADDDLRLLIAVSECFSSRKLFFTEEVKLEEFMLFFLSNSDLSTSDGEFDLCLLLALPTDADTDADEEDFTSP